MESLVVIRLCGSEIDCGVVWFNNEVVAMNFNVTDILMTLKNNVGLYLEACYKLQGGTLA
jgi:hypothetical protein